MALSAVLDSARRGHRALWGFAVANAVAATVMGIASVFDDRTVLGAPLWFKPIKFALSFALYAGALSWLLTKLPRISRPMTIGIWTIVVTSLVEMVIIIGQAARGQRSHFNDSDTLGIVLFGVMGAAVVFLYVGTIVIAVAVLRRRGPDRLTDTALRAGLLITVLGMAVGVVMSLHNGHTVGAADGGPGLPFVGWATDGGDLRIGHFIGMHALQVVPLLAAAIGLGPWDLATKVRLVRTAGAAYTGIVLLVIWQALRAQPLLAPDALTLGALGVIVIGALAAVARTFAAAPSRRPGVRP